MRKNLRRSSKKQCDLLPGQRGPVNEPEPGPGPEPEITIDNGQLSQQGNLLEASCDRVINLTASTSVLTRPKNEQNGRLFVSG